MDKNERELCAGHKRSATGSLVRAVCVGVLAFSVWACAGLQSTTDTVTLSVIGTNDVHGELQSERGGLVAFSGYVSALRELRAPDGAVLLLDGGDMWQGTLESNLGEGAALVKAYNALGYDAATIGNHEFDFGPVGAAAIPEVAGDDPRGALRLRASEAVFPLLAANIIDDATGAAVAWDNVQPAVLIERAGIKVGVVGVTTAETLDATISANTVGLSIAPLADTIAKHAQGLRDRGAALVIVVAHAGGYCRESGNPQDLSSCDNDDEIFAVARALPAGLVNHIIAGHRHRPIAHEVNGIAITSNPSAALSFGRVDFVFDRVSGMLTRRTIYPPTAVCRYVLEGSDSCATSDEQGAVAVSYAERILRPLPSVIAIADVATAQAAAVKAASLGVILETPVTLEGGPFSALGRLMTDATREATGADVAVHNVVGGLRADLPAGMLTFGDVYRLFPFDNRLSLLEVTVADLKKLLAHQVGNTERRVGVSGVHVRVQCDAGVMGIALDHIDGRRLEDDEVLTLAANDYLLLGGGEIFTPITPAGGYALDATQPRVRDLWVAWFKARGGTINAASYLTPEQQRWHLPDPMPSDCRWVE